MEITPEQAARDHQVATAHEQMPNGERRFRLRKGDGTAYIRTEASKDSGWQTSHFHKQVIETYIVQSGWMAFAELVDENLSLHIYGANETVASCPGVIHNVFLSDEAVIHTVKHGAAMGDDRITDPQTEAFDQITQGLRAEVAIRAAAIGGTRRTQYSEEYRHFDNLIWQVPAWSTGIFAISAQALSGVLDKDGDRHWIIGGALALFTALCLACFAFVMMRFRTHQSAFKSYKPTKAWLSASTVTQGLIICEAATAFAAALFIFGIPPRIAIVLASMIGVALICLFERTVRHIKVGS